MDYEELLVGMQTNTKEMGNAIKNQTKSCKGINKNLDEGDLKSLEKELAAMEALCAISQNALADMRERLQGFDVKQYVESGVFEAQLLECCEKDGIDVKGEFPNYEMFPYKVRVDAENMDMYLDRKKLQCIRPACFAHMVKVSREKLFKVPFNAVQFASELAQAYDLTLLRQNVGKPYAPDTDCYLNQIYKLLTPMRRFKKDYDQQSFAFDLARLYAADIDCIDDGRKLQFGTSRNIKQAIRILDAEGREQYLSMIRFYR